MFDRTANLASNRIINYCCNPAEKWLVLIGIVPGSAERPQLVKGNVQLFSVDQQRSQALEAHAAAFASHKVPGNENPSTLLCFALKSTNVGQVTSKLHVIELGAQPGKLAFTKKQADLFFPPDFADDFPVAMQISHKYGFIHVITKFGFLVVYDLETATVIYRNQISPDPIFFTSEASSVGGFYAVNRRGQVLLVTVNEAPIGPFASGQLNNLELNLAKRGNLPGAENLSVPVQSGQTGNISCTAGAWLDNIKISEDIKLKSTTTVANKHRNFTLAEVSKHMNSKDCWLVINSKVYDVTGFLRDHPGGDEILLKATGKDATNDFEKAHSHSSNAMTMMDKFYVGVYDSIASLLIKLVSDRPQEYSHVQVMDFTKDFTVPIGSGGFGDVYKGKLPNGVLIAVKILRDIPGKEKIMEEQFAAEVDTMGRTYHCNLIRLYGYCYDANTKFKALIYDYMESGSLKTVLFEKKLDLPWEKLHNIAKEIAQGISYLHESCYPQIIHQDIKPDNVLLDSNLSPKVIDFGLAKVNIGESQFEQTKIKGTRNYMAPEVNQVHPVKLSCKCDVYSFGMMLFDILGSKRNHVDKRFYFPYQVWEKFGEDQLDKFIIECGIKEEDKVNAKRLSIVALLCVEHNPAKRPMMSTVVKMLEGKINLDKPATPFSPYYYPSSDSSSASDSRDV